MHRWKKSDSNTSYYKDRVPRRSTAPHGPDVSTSFLVEGMPDSQATQPFSMAVESSATT